MKRKDPALAMAGKIGGRSTSKAKREAARRNGAKGGRPRIALTVDEKAETLRVGKRTYSTLG